jgi:hypothetical protein
MGLATRDTLHDRQRSPAHEMTRRADEPSDEQLMTKLDGPGVEAALSELYDRYSRTVFGVGLKITIHGSPPCHPTARKRQFNRSVNSGVVRVVLISTTDVCSKGLRGGVQW